MKRREVTEMSNMTRRSFIKGVGALALAVPIFSGITGCSDGTGIVGTWYGVNISKGVTSTLEVDDDGTWYYNGSYAANGEWNQTDGGTYYLTATLVSLPYEVQGSGEERMLVFSGEDPSATNAAEISKSTFYASEEARDAAAEEIDDDE